MLLQRFHEPLKCLYALTKKPIFANVFVPSALAFQVSHLRDTIFSYFNKIRYELKFLSHFLPFPSHYLKFMWNKKPLHQGFYPLIVKVPHCLIENLMYNNILLHSFPPFIYHFRVERQKPPKYHSSVPPYSLVPHLRTVPISDLFWDPPKNSSEPSNRKFSGHQFS